MDTLVLYGAGSLREVMARIGTRFGREYSVNVITHFGASGRMRERIESGQRVDIFASADIGHARLLCDSGWANAMAMFARNAIGLLAPPGFTVTTETMLEKLLTPGVRIGISPPLIDPLGDYTQRLFDAVDRMRPAQGATLRAHSVVLDNPPESPPSVSGDTDVDGILAGRVDVSIVYCSGRDRYLRLLPEARLIPFPLELQVGPEYGLALMKDARPAAAMLALMILSPIGQAILAEGGFVPVALPSI